MHASWQTLAARLPSHLLPRSGGLALPLPSRDGFLLVGGYTEDATVVPTARARMLGGTPCLPTRLQPYCPCHANDATADGTPLGRLRGQL